VQVEMVFMADVYVPCEHCGGRRFRPEVLEVTYRGKSIADVLELTVDEAIRFFLHEDRLGEALWHLQQVGLGYLRLGQPAPTLSGGEAQRIKIARELALGARRSGISSTSSTSPPPASTWMTSRSSFTFSATL
jgi:excinuclease ABC subunit A